MERLNVFLGRHLWVQVLLSIAVASTLMMLLFPGRSVITVLIRSAVMSVGAVGLLIGQRRRERRATHSSSDDDVIALDVRLRHGEVPTAPQERRAMRGLVEQRLYRMRHRVGALVFLAVLFGGVTVLTAVTATAWRAAGFAVFTVAFVGWSIYHSNLQNRRLRTMWAALADDSEERTVAS